MKKIQVFQWFYIILLPLSQGFSFFSCVLSKFPYALLLNLQAIMKQLLEDLEVKTKVMPELSHERN